jgi:hypothetical protein
MLDFLVIYFSGAQHAGKVRQPWKAKREVMSQGHVTGNVEDATKFRILFGPKGLQDYDVLSTPKPPAAPLNFHVLPLSGRLELYLESWPKYYPSVVSSLCRIPWYRRKLRERALASLSGQEMVIYPCPDSQSQAHKAKNHRLWILSAGTQGGQLTMLPVSPPDARGLMRVRNRTRISRRARYVGLDNAASSSINQSVSIDQSRIYSCRVICAIY